MSLRNSMKLKMGRLFKDPAIEQKLKAIRKDVLELTKDRAKSGQKVLFGMSFSIYEPCRVHDFLLAQALSLRGAEIAPVTCGALQEGECNVFGGIWGGYTGDRVHDQKQSRLNCTKCMKADELLWGDWCGIQSTPLSNYLTNEEREAIRISADSFDIVDYKEWCYDDMPAGQWALDVLRNNALVGDETLVKDYQRKLQEYLYNILLLIEASKKMLDDIAPDIIVANDSFYYMWAVLEKLAAKRAIPFYSHWSGGRRGGWCYAKGEPAMAINLTAPWKTWRDRTLTDDENLLLDEFIRIRPTGKTMMLNTASPMANSGSIDKDSLGLIDFSRPTALLAANVIWDLSALSKDIQFKSMADWILNVIDFFEINPELQLIIKAHPAEENQAIPQTQQLIWDEIAKHRSCLPDNVVFVSPTSSISVYDLMPQVKVGLVFTSTVGLEMSCYGIPVITAGRSPYHGKGFTFDPSDSEEYFRVLKDVLVSDSGQVGREVRISLARRFFYLYYFRYYTALNLFDYSYTDRPVLNIACAKELMPGKNKVLDFVCDSILNHLPIMSQDRWPPKN